MNIWQNKHKKYTKTFLGKLYVKNSMIDTPENQEN